MTRSRSVRVVREGRLVREGNRILDASSSVTVVEAEGKLIVVDTGAREDVPELSKALSSAGLRPDDVSIVVNTHLHSDHTGGNDLFENARFYAHKLEAPPIGTMAISGVTRLLPGVEIVPTPGHTAGSVSLFVHAEHRYAICGDAIPTRANLEQHVPPFVNMDRALALRSMEQIEEFADIVVPGHDAPIKLTAKL